MTDTTESATPSMTLPPVTVAHLAQSIMDHVEEALNGHGRKNYVEKVDFVDIMLDIRKLTQYILDKS
jgi:hypothetical protein